MAEGQVGAAIGASEVPIYYVPKADRSPNVFAQLMSGFLQTRNPAAMMLFEARLREMDPSQRVNELLRAAEADAAQQRAMINLAVAQEQSATNLTKALLQYESDVLRAQATVAAAQVGAEAALRKAEFEPPQWAIEKLISITTHLGDAAGAIREGGPNAGEYFLNQAQREYEALAATARGLEEQAVARKVSEFIQFNFPTNDDVRDVHNRLALRIMEPVAPKQLPGLRAPTSTDEIVKRAAGLAPESTGSSTSVRGLAPPSSDASLPVGGTSTSTAGGEAAGSSGGAQALPEVPRAQINVPASDGTPGPIFRAILEAQRQAKGLGPIGSPIYTRPAKRDAGLAAFLKASNKEPPPEPPPEPEVNAVPSEVTIEAGSAPDRKGALDVRRLLPRAQPPADGYYGRPPAPPETVEAAGKVYRESNAAAGQGPDALIDESGRRIEAFTPEWDAIQRMRTEEAYEKEAARKAAEAAAAKARQEADLAMLQRIRKRVPGAYA